MSSQTCLATPLRAVIRKVSYISTFLIICKQVESVCVESNFLFSPLDPTANADEETPTERDSPIPPAFSPVRPPSAGNAAVNKTLTDPNRRYLASTPRGAGSRFDQPRDTRVVHPLEVFGIQPIGDPAVPEVVMLRRENGMIRRHLSDTRAENGVMMRRLKDFSDQSQLMQASITSLSHRTEIALESSSRK